MHYSCVHKLRWVRRQDARKRHTQKRRKDTEEANVNICFDQKIENFLKD